MFMLTVERLLCLSSLLVGALGDHPKGTQDSYVHTIEVDGHKFVDSATGERFLIYGIDYQPGGPASYTKDHDPLSDPEVCARDIHLFQELGINTVRVYTVNPRLNHDACMTLLAAANVYLLLDVNSPLIGESINRYEPWTTYTPDYLRHVFEVVDQFSRYNNTLGFFIGNEIINDERSAAVSPPYVKAVTRDIKDYMFYNCHRSVPLGYSAADDLRYRKQLSNYLTCGPRESAVDFYGVNSYQWCGEQTMRSSGYDVLIKDHADFGVPLFFSEFGCNLVKPRLFQEVSAIYSSAMTDTFSGGLVYEFSQEENDYGLVEIDKAGNAHLREDFDTLQRQFKNVRKAQESSTTHSSSSLPTTPLSTSIPTTAASSSTRTTGVIISQSASVTAADDRILDIKQELYSTWQREDEGAGVLVDGNDSAFKGEYKYPNTSSSIEALSKRGSRLSNEIVSDSKTKACLASYPNLSGARLSIPDSFGTDMIRNGVRIHRGKYVPSLLQDVPASRFDITRTDGQVVSGAQMVVVNNFSARAGDVGGSSRSGGSGTNQNLASKDTKPSKERKSKTKDSESSASNRARASGLKAHWLLATSLAILCLQLNI